MDSLTAVSLCRELLQIARGMPGTGEAGMRQADRLCEQLAKHPRLSGLECRKCDHLHTMLIDWSRLDPKAADMLLEARRVELLDAATDIVDILFSGRQD